MANNTYIVGSFEYDTEIKSKQAEAEAAKINKLESQMDYSKPTIVYSLYCKIIKNNIFKSPEGMIYLAQLQQYLNDNESLLPGPIPSIPAQVFISPDPNELALREQTKEVESLKRSLWEKEKSLALKQQHIIEKQNQLDYMIENGQLPSNLYEAVHSEEAYTLSGESAMGQYADDKPMSELDSTGQGNINSKNNSDATSTTDENSENDVNNSDAEYIKRLNERYIEDTMRKYKNSVDQNKKLRGKLTVLRIVIIALIIGIGIMFYMASSSDNPNIINYRKTVQNDYADWDQKLKEKENELNQRELELKKSSHIDE